MLFSNPVLPLDPLPSGRGTATDDEHGFFFVVGRRRLRSGRRTNTRRWSAIGDDHSSIEDDKTWIEISRKSEGKKSFSVFPGRSFLSAFCMHLCACYARRRAIVTRRTATKAPNVIFHTHSYTGTPGVHHRSPAQQQDHHRHHYHRHHHHQHHIRG